MRTQQQADREEQQRIKNLVLNYDLSTDNDNDGEDDLSLDSLLQRNPNTKGIKGLEKRTPHRDTRIDKSSSSRAAFRSRKLQLSDVDWYDHKRPGSRSFVPKGSKTHG